MPVPWEWIQEHPVLLTWLGILSIVMVVGGVVLVPWIAARMPADHFLRPTGMRAAQRARHPVLRIVFVVFENALGILLVIAGIAMLVLPGQGILTILAGLALVDFPGKRRLELAIVRRPPVRRTIDWFRRRAGQPPLILDVPPPDEEA